MTREELAQIVRDAFEAAGERMDFGAAEEVLADAFDAERDAWERERDASDEVAARYEEEE